MAKSEPVDRSVAEVRAPEFYEEHWITPPFQPIRAIGALLLIASRFVLYDYMIHPGLASSACVMLIYAYRRCFVPFARFELAEPTAHLDEFRRGGIDTLAISTEQVERSKMLAGLLRAKIPLLSANRESLVAA